MSVSESRVENAAVRARGLARAINTSRSDQPPTLRVDEVRKRVLPLNLATARFIHSVSAGAAESLVIGPCDSIRAVAVKSRPALDADSWTRVLLISPKGSCTESYLPWRFWREGSSRNKTLQKLRGTNPGIRISSDLSL